MSISKFSILLITSIYLSISKPITAATPETLEIFSILSDVIGTREERIRIAEVLEDKIQSEWGMDSKSLIADRVRSEYAKNIDPSLPLRLDEFTHLRSIHVFQNEVRYNLEISQAYMDLHGTKELKNSVRPGVINEICTNASTFLLAIYEFQFHFFYYAPDNSIAATAFVVKSDCL